MKIPIVKKENDKILIELNERQAEILAMLLGTLSPAKVRTIINDYFGRYSVGSCPELCASHKSVDVPGWQEQDTMVTHHVFSGLIKELNWHEKYDREYQGEEET